MVLLIRSNYALPNFLSCVKNPIVVRLSLGYLQLPALGGSQVGRMLGGNGPRRSGSSSTVPTLPICRHITLPATRASVCRLSVAKLALEDKNSATVCRAFSRTVIGK